MDIWVATHKKLDFDLPQGYKPMQVNCKATGEHWEGYLHDDDGINISEKNGSYCELTVLYSLWKNARSEVKGLCHYRRYLLPEQKTEIGVWRRIMCSKQEIKNLALQSPDIEAFLQSYDMILPVPNGPFGFPVKRERLLYCYQKDLDLLRDTIQQEYPAYLEAYDWVMEQEFLPSCNMFIAGRDVFDRYCEWLFDLLGKVEKKCDIDAYDVQHKRVYGYLAECLLNVYVRKQQLRCKYVSRVMISEYWPEFQKGIKGFIKTKFVFRSIKNANPSAFTVWYYKHMEKEKYNNYLLLKQYLADREAETVISGR